MRSRLVSLVLVAGLLASCLPQSRIGTVPEPVVRLSGHVLPALALATKVDASPASAPDAGQPLTITLTLNRADQPGFEQYLASVQAPGSPTFQRFLTLDQITQRFGPTQQAYDTVLGWLTSQGFTLVEGSGNRQTLTVTGSAAQVQRAFDVHVAEYEIDGRRFRANDADPALPASIAPYVQAVTGLTDLARLQSEIIKGVFDFFFGPDPRLANISSFPGRIDTGVGFFPAVFGCDNLLPCDADRKFSSSPSHPYNPYDPYNGPPHPGTQSSTPRLIVKHCPEARARR